MSKKFFVLFVSIVMTLSFSSSSLAANNPQNDQNLLSPGVKEGFFVTSKSVDDETGLEDPVGAIRPLQTSGLIYKDAGYYGSSYLVEQATAKGDSTIRREFVRYLTSSWAKAQSYTWSTSNSTSWSFGGTLTIGERIKSALSLSTTRTTTYSVAITIPADTTKFSKLGFASDFFRQNYYYEKIVDGTVVATETSYIKTPTVDTYLIVYYQ